MTAIALATISARASAETFTGREVQSLARRTIDVMRAHHYTLDAQMYADEVGSVTAILYKHASATLQFVDGSESDGGLTRIGLLAGGGTGKPRSGFAGFVGAQADYLVVDGAVADHTEVGDGLLFVGAAVRGLQASLGLRFAWSRGFTEGGEFPGQSPFTDRPGTPPAAREPEGSDPVTRFDLSGFVVSTHHAEGVTLGGVVDDALREQTDGTVTRGRVLAAARALLQPRRWIDRLDARDLGVPGVGLDRLAPEVDYWGDRFEENRRALADPTRLARLPTPEQALYEIPFVVDDLAGIGLHLKAVTQVSPSPLFRQAQVGWTGESSTLFGGARASTFRRADSFVPSFDLFGGARIVKIYSAAISLSYNSPDAATSIALPNSLIWGVQIIAGRENLVHPIVPVVRGPADGEEGETR